MRPEGIVRRHVVGTGDRRQRTELRIGAGGAGQLRRAEEARRVRHRTGDLAIRQRGNVGDLADAPRVQHLDRRREELRSFEKELTFLRIVGLEGRQVEDLLIRLDLREVRVDRDIRGQRRREVPLEITSDRCSRRVRAIGEPRDRGQRVWTQLEAIRFGENIERGERPVARRLTRLASRNRRQLVDLLARRDESPNLEPPGLARASVVPEHAERDPDLRAPTGGRVSDLRLPVLVPVLIDLGVVVAKRVDQHACRIDLEVEGVAAGRATVEIDLDAVRVDLAITPGQTPHDR